MQKQESPPPPFVNSWADELFCSPCWPRHVCDHYLSIVSNLTEFLWRPKLCLKPPPPRGISPLDLVIRDTLLNFAHQDNWRKHLGTVRKIGEIFGDQIRPHELATRNELVTFVSSQSSFTNSPVHKPTLWLFLISIAGIPMQWHRSWLHRSNKNRIWQIHGRSRSLHQGWHGQQKKWDIRIVFFL